MPIYEYQCKKCGQVTELLQKMGANIAGSSCPACGADALQKKLSVMAVPAKIAGRADTGGCELAAAKEGACGGCCGGCQ